jgi:site-specific recombinase
VSARTLRVESIAEADSALRLSLAGDEARVVAQASSSKIPVIGQAVLGFVLPFILAMVAIPLEMLLDSGRHVLASVCVLALAAVGALARGGAYVSGALATLLVSVYEIYISIPLRIERAVREPRTTS